MWVTPADFSAQVQESSTGPSVLDYRSIPSLLYPPGEKSRFSLWKNSIKHTPHLLDIFSLYIVKTSDSLYSIRATKSSQGINWYSWYSGFDKSEL